MYSDNKALSTDGISKSPRIDMDIRSRVAAARLPSLPAVLLKLMELCQSEETGMKELLPLIAQDAGMTARVFVVANSTAYRRGDPVGTLDQALQSIGIEMIKLIVINVSVSQVFDKMSKSLGVDLRPFWTHALLAGLAARAVAKKTGYSNSEEAYLTGLLHDVGRLVLFAILPREYRFNFLAADNEDLCAVEERTMQTTHAEVGSWLIEHWKLDSFMADSVLYHHEPPERLQKSHPLIRIAHVAHSIASTELSNGDLEKSGALCALRLKDLLDIRAAALAQQKKSADALNMDQKTDSSVSGALARSDQSDSDPGTEKMMEQVRTMMLSSALERSLNHHRGQENLLEAVSRSARILFQFDSAVIFLMNPTGVTLLGSQCGEHRQRLADFVLPLDTPGSTIARAAMERRITFTAARTPGMSVIEEQLLRLFATDHLACLPLCADNHCLAILVGGFKAWQGEDLQRRISFLHTFSSQAAAAFKSLTLQKEEAEKISEDLAADFRDAARKVAHEVNNPLSIIKNYLGILDRKLMSKSAITAEVAILNEEIERIGDIIDEFAEMKLPKRDAHINVNRVIEDVLRLFRQAEFASPVLRIENRLQQQSHAIEGSSDTLKQIFVNLIKNAAEAMPDGGLVEVGSDGLVSRDGVLYVDLWVRDAGPGIAPEVMSRLFAPVVSTKGNGHSGLGLNIVNDLVKKMHGFITCRSSKQGTTFEILLPAARSSAAESAD